MSEEKKPPPKPGNYASLLTLDKEVTKKPKPVKKDNPAPKKILKNDRKRSRSRSPKKDEKKTSNKADSKSPKKEKEIDYDIPDRTLGDLYCKPCDAHMNSDQMWEAHIQGKRHLKNTKKGETVEPKFEYVLEDPLMQSELDAHTKPIVGLHHICEIQRIEQQRPIYQCFLCSANLPSSTMLLNHLAGIKHRLAYLKEHDEERYTLIKNSDLKKGHLEPVVEECMEKHERDKGRGKMRVKREIDTGPSVPYSKKAKKSTNHFPPFDSYDDVDRNWRRQNSPDRGFHPYDRYNSPPRHDKEYWYDRPRDFPPRDYPPRDFPPGNFPPRDFHPRDFPPGDFPPRDYPPRDLPPRDLPPRDLPPRDLPPRDLPPRDLPPKDPYYDLEADGIYGRQPPYPDMRSTETAPFHRPSEWPIEDSRDSVLHNPVENKKVQDFLKKDQTPLNISSTNTTSILANSAAMATSSNIPDNLLVLINALNNVAFLQLALFKLDRMEITEQVELKMLDRLASKATGLSVELKAKMLPTNLQAKFKESMLQNGIIQSNTFSNDFENLMKMVGQYKQNIAQETASATTAQNVQQSQSRPVYSSSFYDNSSSKGVFDCDMLKNSDSQQSSSVHHNWTQSLTSFSSNQSAIPGLTLTDDKPSAPQSPFDILARQAKDILGRVRQAAKPSYHY